MTVLDLISANLLSPMFLAFFLGVGASLVRSDLEFPQEIYTALSIYLLMAIGLKGGVALSDVALSTLVKPMGVTLGLGVIIPLWVFFFVNKVGGFNREDAGALAAHYGSVSAVTFISCIGYLNSLGIFYEKYASALLAVLEIPAIAIGLSLASPQKLWEGLKKVLVSKSVLLLGGGLVIGYLSGPEKFEKISSFFVHPFQGVLVLFLLELGLVTGKHFEDLRHVGPFILIFGIIAPLFNGCLGLFAGHLAGLSVGGQTILAVLAASASYIAAPAAVRIALPNANPATYLTPTLAITFPFNLAFGIPLFLKLASGH